MSRPGLLQQDISTRQQVVLDTVLRAEAGSKQPPRISVAEAKAGDTLFEADSNREAVRLLFISRDTTLLNQTQQSLDGYLQLSEVFDEVHIVILRPGISAKNPVLRVANNVWIYIATAPHWWQTPFAALRLIDEQLVFADGFRPDLIVARDPYECGFVAHSAGKHYDRPTQVHIMEDFTTSQFLKEIAYARWRRKIAQHVVPKFLSVRTTTNQLREKLQELFPAIPDIDTLPRFNSYENLVDQPVTVNIKEKYQQYSFIFVYFGALTHQSSLPVVLDAFQEILRNPRIGLVVVGNGPFRDDLQHKAKVLKIAEQVVFERTTDDVIGYLKTADALVVSDTDVVSDEIAIRGAVVGIPMICTLTSLRQDLFVSGESALLCNLVKEELEASFILLLDDFEGRQRLRHVARAAIASRLLRDRTQYRFAYRTSVEQGLFAGVLDTTAVVTEKNHEK